MPLSSKRSVRISWNGESSSMKRLAVGINAKDAPGRFGADEQVAGLVEGQRRGVRGLGLVERRAFAVRGDLVDDALFAGARVEVALGVGRQRPDVLLLRIEERRRGPVAIDLVDLAVRRGGDVEAAVGRRRQRVHLELRRVEEGRCPCLARRS